MVLTVLIVAGIVSGFAVGIEAAATVLGFVVLWKFVKDILK